MTQPIVTVAQMQAIEQRILTAGLPVAALMEKVGGLISRRFQQFFPLSSHPRVGVILGAGHNGGDALVVARELHLAGYQVQTSCPLPNLKDLTAQHYQYVISLGVRRVDPVAALQDCDVILDGLFGIGLNRDLSEDLIALIDEINSWQRPIVSIDIPSGIHADTGAMLGAAIRAQHTFCLGLWKWAYAQDRALPFLGQSELLGFDIPTADIEAVLGPSYSIQVMDRETAAHYLPYYRPPVTHKYQQGHLLLIAGSECYAGAAILAGLGARASGVGLLSIAVPQSIKLAVLQHLPDAIILGCPETAQGAIAQLPDHLDWSKYTAIAGGCGLTPEPMEVIKFILAQNLPLVLDADALNTLARLPRNDWTQRLATTILTPHGGEWRRLFPQTDVSDRISATIQTAQQTGSIILHKGARTIISDGFKTWAISNGTPALARGEVVMF